jgi:hypothetical protein
MARANPKSKAERQRQNQRRDSSMASTSVIASGRRRPLGSGFDDISDEPVDLFHFEVVRPDPGWNQFSSAESEEGWLIGE